MELQDILHHYTGQPCHCFQFNHDETLKFDKAGIIFAVWSQWKAGDKPWPVEIKYKIHPSSDVECKSFYHFNAIKPLLLPLEDMTEDVAWSLIMQGDFYKDKNVRVDKIYRGKIYFRVQYNNARWWPKEIPIEGNTPKHFLFLMKLGYDLFQLIKLGLALDRSKHPEI